MVDKGMRAGKEELMNLYINMYEELIIKTDLDDIIMLVKLIAAHVDFR